MSNTETPTCEKCEQLLEEIVPATWALTHKPCGHVKTYCSRHHERIETAFLKLDYIVCDLHTPWQDCTSIRWTKLPA